MIQIGLGELLLYILVLFVLFWPARATRAAGRALPLLQRERRGTIEIRTDVLSLGLMLVLLGVIVQIIMWLN